MMCCFCGLNKATTKDHIPPKAIFNKPRPNDLITVPACQECNNAASVADEKFKAYLGMRVARHGGDGEKLFKNGVLPTLRHNSKLMTTVLQNMQQVYLKSPGGIITNKAMAVRWNDDTHDLTIERIIRGLFYHHYKKILPKNVFMQAYWFDQPPLSLEENNLYSNSIGGDTFTYLHNVADDSDFDSIWFFQFYGKHWAGGITLSADSTIPFV